MFRSVYIFVILRLCIRVLTLHWVLYVHDVGTQNEEAAKQLYHCHDSCRLHRSSSLCTLSGEQLQDFIDRLEVDISCDSVNSDSAQTEYFSESDEAFTA